MQEPQYMSKIQLRPSTQSIPHAEKNISILGMTLGVLYVSSQ